MENQIIFQSILRVNKKTDPPVPLNYSADINEKQNIQLPPELDGILLKQIRVLIEDYAKDLQNARRGYTPIHVDEISSKIARFYEMIRKVIDWKEDSELRRGAIDRTLKRILFPRLSGIANKKITPHDLAETITIELIRGGHLPNDTIPYERIIVLSDALEKYFYLLDHPTITKQQNVKQKINTITFILEIASCEIEELLTNPVKEYGTIEAMTSILSQRTQVLPLNSVSEEEKHQRFYIAVCQTLYDLDDKFVTYRLLRKRYSFWHHPDPAQMENIVQDFTEETRRIKKYIDSALMRRFTVIAEKMDTVFLLIDDALEKMKESPKEILGVFEDKKQLSSVLKESYQKRFATLKKRLFRLAIFSTLSVFLSNWITFFVVEVPLARLFYEKFNILAALVDFIIPTIVMFLLVTIIKPPSEENEKKVISTSLGFIYTDEKQEHFQIRNHTRRFSLFHMIMMGMYLFTMIGVFGLVAYVFYIARLPVTSVIFDTFTIALTVFAAVIIRNKSKELTVDEHVGILDFILDVLSVPIAKVGSVLASKWKEYNVISIFFNFIIETPFAVILYFIDRWSEFIKERRAEFH